MTPSLIDILREQQWKSVYSPFS